MRLEEIDGSDAAAQRVQRLKANAKSAEDRAKQMKTQAEANAQQLKMQQSRQQLMQLSRSAAGSTIKPHV